MLHEAVPLRDEPSRCDDIEEGVADEATDDGAAASPGEDDAAATAEKEPSESSVQLQGTALVGEESRGAVRASRTASGTCLTKLAWARVKLVLALLWALLLVWMWRRRGLQRSAWRQRLRQWLMGGISGGGALLLSMA